MSNFPALMNNRLYTIQEVANILGVSTKTLRRWDQRGRLVPTRTVGNQRRYTQQQIAEFKTSSSSKASEGQAKLLTSPRLRGASKTVPQAEPLFDLDAAPKAPKATHSLPSALSGLPSGSFLKNHFLLKHKDQLESTEPASFARPPLAKLNGEDEADSESFNSEGKLRSGSKANPFKMGLIFAAIILILSLGGAVALTKYDIVAGLAGKKEFAKFIDNLSQFTLSIDPKELGFVPSDNQAVLAASDDSSLVLNVNVPAFFTQNVGIGTTAPETSAILDLMSESQGFLAPRMTEAQVEAIETPAAGLFVYNTDTNHYNMYNGTEWQGVFSSIGDSTAGEAFTETGTSGTSLFFYDADGRGKLTIANLSGVRTYTLPDASGEVSLLGQTISNAELVNSKVTISAGTNMTGGGDVSLGSSVTLTLKDSIDLGGTLDVSGATVLDAALTVAGATAITGALTTKGNVTLGDATSDTITFTGRVAQDSDLIPITATGTNDLGTSALPWDNVYADNVFAASAGTSGYWQRNSQALSPTNITDDVLLGATSTGSAKFGFINVGGGTPTATISANSGNNATYLTGDGTLATTNRGTLTIGNSSSYNTTGNVLINPNGTGNVGIGIASPANRLDVRIAGSATAVTDVIRLDNTTTATANGAGAGILYTLRDGDGSAVGAGGIAAVWSNYLGANRVGDLAFYARNGGSDVTERMRIAGTGNVGIGITAPTSSLYVTRPLTFGATGKALAVFDQIESQDILTASASGTTRFVIRNDGNVGIGESLPGSKLSVSGGATIGSSYDTTAAPSNGLIVEGNVGIKTTTPTTFDLEVGGHVGPTTATTYDLGSSAKRWLTVYADTGNFTNIAGVITGGSTNAADWLINADNATADTEDATLSFDRGTPSTNSQFKWNATTKQLSTNSPSFAILPDASINFSGTSALMVNQIQSQDILTASASGTTRFTIANSGNTTIVGDLAVNGATSADITSTTTTGTLFDTTVTTLSLGGAATTLNIGTTDSVTRTINFGTGTGADTINIGTGATTANTVNIGTGAVANTIAIGSSSTTGFSLTDDNWSVSAAGVTLMSLGSASAPSYSFTGDTNTGVWSSAADTLNLSTGGTERIRIDSTGNVGFGTTAPTSELYVTRPLSFGATGKALAVFDQIESQDILTASTSGTTRFVISNAGNVGIGTSLPTTLLSLANNGWFSGVSTASGAVNMFKVNTADQIQVGGSLNIDGSFNFPSDAGYVTAMDLPLTSGQSSGTDNGYAFRIGSSNIMTVFAENNGSGNILDGRVGIGTTAPSGTFHVTGIPGGFATAVINNAGSTGDIFAASSSGTMRFVIRNDGNVGIGTALPGAMLAVGSSTPTLVSSAGLVTVANTTDTTSGITGSINTLGGVGITKSLWVGGSANTAQIFAPLGAVGAPGYSFQSSGTSDPNTGMWSSGADTVNFSTAGSERARIASDGNVGIGTTSPAVKLHVYDATTPYIRVEDSTNAVKLSLIADNSFGYLETSSNHSLLIRTNGSEKMRIDTSGNVGLGTTAPTSELFVTRPASMTATGKALAVFDQIESQDILTASTSGTTRFVISNAGNVGIGIALPIGVLHVNDANNASVFQRDSSERAIETRRSSSTASNETGISFKLLDSASNSDEYAYVFGGITSATSGSETGYLAFGTRNALSSAVEKMRLTSAGNVGIGTNSPLELLHVAGNATASGNLTLSGGNRTIQTTALNTLTIGGTTTGNIVIDSGSSSITLSDATTLSSTLAVTGITTLTGNLNANGGFDVDDAFVIADGGKVSTLDVSDTDIALTGATTTFTSTGDITIDSGGGDIIFSDADTLNIGGSGSDVAYNIIGDTTTGVDSRIGSDDDLFVEGNLHVLGDFIGPASGVSGYWQRASGALAPFNITDDVLLGATSTSSAKFGFINVAGGTPTATISANSGNNATTLTGLGVLGTTNMQTLTLGNSTTGNIVIDSGSSAITLSDATTLSSTLAVTGDTTLTGDLAVNGGDLTTTAATFNLVNAATTVNLGSTNIARTLNFGTGTDIDTINIGTGATGVDVIRIGQGAADLALTDANWSITTAGLITTADDVAVNGGDLTTTTTGTFNLVNANATTVNFAQAATTLTMGATTGTATIRNATLDLPNGSATVSGNLTLYGAARTIQTTAMNTLTIGGSTTGNIAVDSNVWDITGAGVASGLTGLTSSGTITFSGLTASRAVFTNSSSALVTTGASSDLLNALSDETGTGVAVFGTAPTFTTSITDPLVIGGTGTTSTLTLRSTSGVGASGADIIFQTGNNGATEAMRILNSGNVGIGTTAPLAELGITGSATISGTLTVDTVRPETGALSLQYKSGLNAWTTGLTLLDNSGNVGIGDASPATLFVVGSGDLLQVDSSGRLFLPAGASGAGNLALSTTGDTNTGLYFSAADEIRIQTGGSDRVTINSSGNVGIGTTAPQTTVEIVDSSTDIADAGSFMMLRDSAATTGRRVSIAFAPSLATKARAAIFAESATAGGADLVFATLNSNDGTELTTTHEKFRITGGVTTSGSVLVNDTGADVDFRIEGDNLDRAFFVDASVDNIGIGTSAPTSMLYVTRPMTVPVTGKALAVFDQIESQDILTASAAGTMRFVIRRDGNVGIGTALPGEELHVAGSGPQLRLVANDSSNASISFYDNTTRLGDIGYPNAANQLVTGSSTGDLVLRTSSDDILFSLDDGTTINMMLESTGDFGIGTTNPAYRLDVNGTAATTQANIQTSATGTTANVALRFAAGDGAIWAVGRNVGDASDDDFVIREAGVADRLVIEAGGHVGIGTVSPTSQLNVTRAMTNAVTGKALAVFDQIESQDILTASASGTTRFVINNAGNVGIGVAIPANKLDVRIAGSATALTDVIRLDNTTTATANGAGAGILYTLRDSGGSAVGAGGIAALWSDYTGNRVGDLAFYTRNGGSDVTERMRIAGGGNVGIGITAPTANLQVNSAAGSNPSFRISDADVAHGMTDEISTDSIGSLAIYSTGGGNGGGGLSIKGFSANAATRGLHLLGVIGDANPTDTEPAIMLVGARKSSTTIADLGNAETVFQVTNNDNTPSLTLLGSGNFGLGGQTTPLAALDVTGSASLSGNMWFRGAGTAHTFNILDNGTLNFQRWPGGDAANNTSVMFLNSNGNVGIGTTAPGSLLSLANNSWISGISTASGSVNMIKVNTADQIQVGGALNIDGSFNFPSDAGYVTAMDLPLTSAQSANTANGYVFRVGSSNLMTIYGENNGSGTLQNGRVGIGITAPLIRLDVQDSQSATAAAQIYNTNTGTDADGLIVKLGNTSTTVASSTNHFVSFETFGIGIVGSVQGSGGKGVTYATSGIADFAEYFKKDENHNIPFGSIVCLQDNGLAAQCDGNNGKIIGVASERPAFLGGENLGAGSIAVGLVGQVKTRVSTVNGAIRIGDPLTSSTTPGIAVKATSVGQIIGKALQAYDGPANQVGEILVSVNITWYNPNIYVSYDGTLAGMATTMSSIGDQLTLQGEELALQGEALQAQIASNSARLSTLEQDTDYVLATDPLFDSLSNKVLDLESQIGLLNMQAEQLASTSAFLTEIINSQVLGASASAALELGDVEVENLTIGEDLMVLGRTTVSDLGVTGNINAGLLAIHGIDGEIGTLAGDLYLQKSGLGGVNILNGLVVIDTTGNMTVAGTITADAVEAKSYTVTGEQSIGSATIPAGATSIEVTTAIASSSSKIFLTSTSLTDKQITVIQKTAGKFKVAIPEPTTSPISFDWWIVGNTN